MKVSENENLLKENNNYNSYDIAFLVVDDNKHIRLAIKNNLIKALLILNPNLSYKIIEGYDGVDILRYIIDDQIENKIKCVFTDENMEYINGSEAIRILHDLEKRNKIKKCFLVSITSHEDEYSNQMIYNAGVDLIIPKPISKNNMIKILNDLNI